MFMRQGIRHLITGLGLALVVFALLCFSLHEFAEGLLPSYLYFLLALIVTVGLSCIVLLAIYAPTKRAVLMEPSSALRYE
jgi:ABC-type lipoprotein release transport system permease subunit